MKKTNRPSGRSYHVPTLSNKIKKTAKPKTNWQQILEFSYEQSECGSRLEFLGDAIFDFTTYDSAMTEVFARNALDVSVAIASATTFDFIESRGRDYAVFLVMCNMPFFIGRLGWGSSIRGAWWCDGIALKPTMLFNTDYSQILDLTFTKDGWSEFIYALQAFAEADATVGKKVGEA